MQINHSTGPILEQNHELDPSVYVKNQPVTIEHIVDDLLLLIFKELDAQTLCKISSLVSKKWRRLSQNEQLWQFMCQREFSGTFLDIPASPARNETWHLAYHRLVKLFKTVEDFFEGFELKTTS